MTFVVGLEPNARDKSAPLAHLVRRWVQKLVLEDPDGLVTLARQHPLVLPLPKCLSGI